jgi:hypothetical protein
MLGITLLVNEQLEFADVQIGRFPRPRHYELAEQLF